METDSTLVRVYFVAFKEMTRRERTRRLSLNPAQKTAAARRKFILTVAMKNPDELLQAAFEAFCANAGVGSAEWVARVGARKTRELASQMHTE